MEKNIKTLLVVMPFHNIRTPNIGVSILKSVLQQHNYPCDIYYANIDFASFIEEDFSDRTFELDTLGNDAIFSQVLNPQVSTSELEAHYSKVDLYIKSKAVANEFIEFAAQKIVSGAYQLIGFTVIFQTIASLALARRVKELSPDIKIIFGGSNCEGEMGLALHQNFGWIDYVCMREGEKTLLELVRRLNGEAIDIEQINGLIHRKDNQSVVNPIKADQLVDLNEAPFPDYSDWFEQLHRNEKFKIPVDNLIIPLESSRGCWYGNTQQCVFCGLSGANLTPRTKDAEILVSEIKYSIDAYKIKQFITVDLIFPKQFYDTLLPRLTAEKFNISIIYEVKSNLLRPPLQRFKEAGILYLQPGIESLDTDMLTKMRKGTLAYQNVRLLKWAPEYGISLVWNILSELPGEQIESYLRMVALIPHLVHLQPPTYGVFPIVLQRFSPMFNNPDEFNIIQSRPLKNYYHIYDLPDHEIRRLAYYFDFETNHPTPKEYVDKLKEQVRKWFDSIGQAVFISLSAGDMIYFYDSRPCSVNEYTILNKTEAQLYQACDAGATLKEVCETSAMPEPEAISKLENLINRKLLIFIDNRYLSLAVNLDSFKNPDMDMETNLYVCASHYRVWMTRKCREILKVGRNKLS